MQIECFINTPSVASLEHSTGQCIRTCTQTSHNYRAGEGALLSASASLDTMTMMETDVASDSPLRRAKDTPQQSMLEIQGEIIGRLSVRQILHSALHFRFLKYDTGKCSKETAATKVKVQLVDCYMYNLVRFFCFFSRQFLMQ